MPGSVISGVLGASAANKAAKAQTKAADQAIAEQQRQYDTSRGDMMPYMTAGYSALNRLMQMGGLPTVSIPGTTTPAAQTAAQPAATAAPADVSGINAKIQELTAKIAMSNSNADKRTYQSMLSQAMRDLQTVQRSAPTTTTPVAAAAPAATEAPFDINAMLQSTPGYQFRQAEGEKAIQRSAAAKSGLLSGASIKALQAYGDGLASDEFTNYWNRLSGIAGTGQTQTNALASLGAAKSGDVAQTLLAKGTAKASGYVGVANALSKGIEGISSFMMPGSGSGSFNWFGTAS